MFSLVILFNIIYFVNCHECILQNSSKTEEKKELLNKISVLEGPFYAEIGNYTYALSICSYLSKYHPLAGATRSKPGTGNVTVVLGRHSNTDVVGSDFWILLTYSSGDRVINETCNSTTWKTTIFITCNPGASEVSLLETNYGGDCNALFHLKSSLVCPEVSPWSTLRTIMILGVIVMYFLIGICYRRFVLGAKGLEQVPHYRFWHSIITFPLVLVRKVLGDESLRSRGAANQLAQLDTADEPLLSP